MKLEQEDKVISEFLNSIDPWRNHIVIGGGYALFIYKLYFDDNKLENLPIGTTDIDSLISRKVPDMSKKNISEHLIEAGFNPVIKDYDHPASEAYVKQINGLEIEVEFLTDSSTRMNKNKNVMISGVVAQPLSYLTLSLQKTLKFQTQSKEVGFVVSPEAWIFHKGLTFTKRKNQSKKYKDLYGIWYASSQLGKFSEKAVLEFQTLISQHPKWFSTFQRNLQNWIATASPLEWSMLEIQDTSGKLKRLSFESIVKRLTSSQR